MNYLYVDDNIPMQECRPYQIGGKRCLWLPSQFGTAKDRLLVFYQFHDFAFGNEQHLQNIFHNSILLAILHRDLPGLGGYLRSIF